MKNDLSDSTLSTPCMWTDVTNIYKDIQVRVISLSRYMAATKWEVINFMELLTAILSDLRITTRRDSCGPKTLKANVIANSSMHFFLHQVCPEMEHL